MMNLITRRNGVLLLLYMVLFSSCSSLTITKRRYSNGFHVEFFNKRISSTPKKIAEKSNKKEFLIDGAVLVKEEGILTHIEIKDRVPKEEVEGETHMRSIHKEIANGSKNKSQKKENIHSVRVLKKGNQDLKKKVKSQKQDKKSFWYYFTIVLISIIPLGATVAIFVLDAGPSLEAFLSFGLYALYIPGVIYGIYYLRKESPDQSELNEILLAFLIIVPIIIYLLKSYHRQ
jgi:hypothetical protein